MPILFNISLLCHSVGFVIFLSTCSINFLYIFSVNPSVNDDGLHIGGLIGFLRSVRYTCDILKPSRCIIVFDGKGGSSRRRKIYPEYKGNRKSKHKFNRHIKWGLAPENEEHAMRQQISRLVEYLEQLP